jgi:transcriptional regulator with XRE-family HTH domain
MPKPLTPEQLNALRMVPLFEMPNKVRLAITLAQAQQQDIVEETGIAASRLSGIVTGNSGRAVWLNESRQLAAFFGCEVDDLFPREEPQAVSA